jgi:RNA polymerase sigma-70 factor (ECF subfamily)
VTRKIRDSTKRRSALTDEVLKARGDLLPRIYAELRRLAGWHLKKEGPGHTLQPTALANEAYLRLMKDRKVTLRQHTRFMAVASMHMRRVLLDHHRRKSALKRFGAVQRVTLSDEIGLTSEGSLDFHDLHEALTRLEAVDPRRARVVEYRYFGNLGIEETAKVLEVAPRTVKRDWTLARGWLRRELSRRKGGTA